MALRFTLFILSLAAYGLLYVFTAIMVLAGMPFVYLRAGRVVRYMMRFWAKAIFLIIGKRIEVRGRENIPADRHYILVANHSSLFDIVAIISVLPDITWFGHERLLKIPVFKNLLLLTGYIPMRKAGYRNTMDMITKLRERSATNNIAIFPEGTRSLDGKINDFYRGFIILLRSSEVDVVPVSLNGFYSLKPKNRFTIDFSSSLEMTIHKPYHRDELIGRSDSEIAGVIKTTIQSAVSYVPSGGEADLNIENPKKILA